MSGPAVVVRDDRAHLTFDRFDLDAYQTFLAVKRLPEHELVYDHAADSYHVSTPARFASLLTDGAPVRPDTTVDVAPHLFDYQAWILRTALDAKRYACWLDTGLGKTPTYLEWANSEQHSVEWSCQWPVRPHRRMQWYPSVGQHRPRWIEGYVKGPADKPLRHAERLFAVVR